MSAGPMTTDEVVAALADGDSFCECGYLKSKHGGALKPPAVCGRFTRSSSFNSAAMAGEDYLAGQRHLFVDEKATTKRGKK